MQYNQYCAHMLQGRVGGVVKIAPQIQQPGGGTCSVKCLESDMLRSRSSVVEPSARVRLAFG